MNMTLSLNQKIIENRNRLDTANTLCRELHALKQRVLRICIASQRPRLYLEHAPLTALPLRGIVRRRVDHDLFECSAILNGCDVVWHEFEGEMAA